MYYPYLRGKQFELQAIENIDHAVYSNTIPIVEPMTRVANTRANNVYSRLATASNPLICIVNPDFRDLTENQTRANFINNHLAGHTNLTLGYIISQHTTPSQIRTFLTSDLNRQKALIFKANFTTARLNSIVNEVRANQPAHLVFESRKTGHTTQTAFAWHPHRVLITDGFQSQIKNANYPANSFYSSDYLTYRGNGWSGIGDYQTLGEEVKEGGAPPYVVALHLTRDAGPAHGLMVDHYLSYSNTGIQGDAGPKFLEACGLLVTSPLTMPLTSTGLTLYRRWNTASHFPTLGGAKQASLQHHIELLSRLV